MQYGLLSCSECGNEHVGHYNGSRSCFGRLGSYHMGTPYKFIPLVGEYCDGGPEYYEISYG